MAVDDIINFMNMTVKNIAPLKSRMHGILWRDVVMNVILNTIAETLRTEASTIEEFVKKEGGINKNELEKSVDELVETMILHAKRQGRKEVLPEDFTAALEVLEWHIFPFCKSGGGPVVSPSAGT